MGFHVTVKENQERTYLGTNGFFKDAIGPNAETDRTMAIMRIIELKTTKYIVRMWLNEKKKDKKKKSSTDTFQVEASRRYGNHLLPDAI